MSKGKPEVAPEVEQVAQPAKAPEPKGEQAPLALTNLLSRGVKMKDAKARLGIK